MKSYLWKFHFRFPKPHNLGSVAYNKIKVYVNLPYMLQNVWVTFIACYKLSSITIIFNEIKELASLHALGSTLIND